MAKRHKNKKHNIYLSSSSEISDSLSSSSSDRPVMIIPLFSWYQNINGSLNAVESIKPHDKMKAKDLMDIVNKIYRTIVTTYNEIIVIINKAIDDHNVTTMTHVAMIVHADIVVNDFELSLDEANQITDIVLRDIATHSKHLADMMDIIKQHENNLKP